MKIKELIYETPEMTEDKLKLIINEHLNWLRPNFKERILKLHNYIDLSQAVLDEYDLVQDKKSLLTKSQRDQIIGFVGACLIMMTKGNGGNSTNSDNGNPVEDIQSAEEIRND